jgi:hypothetical protein
VDPPLLGCLLAWNLVLAPCFFFFYSPKYLIVATLQFATIKLIWAEEVCTNMAEENTGICAMVFSFSVNRVLHLQLKGTNSRRGGFRV